MLNRGILVNFAFNVLIVKMLYMVHCTYVLLHVILCVRRTAYCILHVYKVLYILRVRRTI
jgi:hypothetical protein